MTVRGYHPHTGLQSAPTVACAVRLVRRRVPVNDKRGTATFVFEHERARSSPTRARLTRTTLRGRPTRTSRIEAGQTDPPAPVEEPHDGADERAAADLNMFRREGDYWSVVFEGRTLRVRDLKGMHYLVRLLPTPTGTSTRSTSSPPRPARSTHAVPTLGRTGEREGAVPPRAPVVVRSGRLTASGVASLSRRERDRRLSAKSPIRQGPAA